MKTASLFFAASMAVAVAAKGLTDVLPKCALDCVEKAAETAECALDDTDCICADQATYQAILQPAVDCMVKACGQEETLTKIAPAVVKFCVAAKPKAPAASSSASASSPAATKTTHAASSKASSKAASEASSPASPAASETSPEASKTANPEKKWTSDQPSEAPETTAGGSPTAAESEQPSSTTAPSSAAAAGAAGPMVTAALLVAGAVAML